jgi:lipoprotein-anchoring transpeptidase ErfK/SrfK|tara:strand:+ start:73159 stop:74136 length:978 start_codon:yes stop_codon:yes gene_type:complete
MSRLLTASFLALSLVAAPLAAMQSQGGEENPAVRKGKISAAIFQEERTPEKLSAQILLDRAGFSPGVIDGYGGGNTEAAVRAWQEANGETADGKITAELLRALRDKDSKSYLTKIELSQEDVSRNYVQIPEGMAAQAEMDSLGYSSVEEMLAERYHMDVDFLKALNPDADFSRAGESVMVVRAGPAKLDKTVARIEISRTNNRLRAYNENDELLAVYPATVGSSGMPSPSGNMSVRTVAPEATYHFDPSTNDWGGDEALTLAAGPNNPVGGVWIDLTKDTYGIHGSPDPALIGKTASHGCVRLTNWDARELAAAVRQGTKVAFVN